MDIPLGFNRNYRKWFLNPVLSAVRRYGLIQDDERVCVALSGGKDSAALLFILYLLNRYSPLHFRLNALHIRTGAYATDVLAEFCRQLDVPYYEQPLEVDGREAPARVCSLCARLKRGAMAATLKKHGISTVAFGHHATDVAETFFMNVLHNRKLGSFSPKVSVPESAMTIIRPMIYLLEEDIRRIHRFAGLPLLEFDCPYADKNVRAAMKLSIGALDQVFATRHFSRLLVESLENIDYSNIWPQDRS
jgi:tRNA(Ile)-lysidine synthase TilS/MesJ